MRMKHERDQAVEALKDVTFDRDRAITTMNDADTPTGLSNILKLSPNSKEIVVKAAKKGVRRTETSASPNEKRNYFMERVGTAYAPLVEKMLSTPTFEGRSRDLRGTFEGRSRDLRGTYIIK